MAEGRAPGLSVEIVEPTPEPTPLRTDVAGIFGRTRRGPRLAPVRVAGWRAYQREFGGLVGGAATPYSARGYFENGGEAAWVVRIAAATSRIASADWNWTPASLARANFASETYGFEATSAGRWAEGGRLDIRYRARGIDGTPEVDVRVAVAGEPVERFPRIAPPDLVEALTASRLIRAVPLGPPVTASLLGGRQSMTWTVRLEGGTDELPSRADYMEAVRLLEEIPEVALLAAPDLHDDLVDPVDVEDVLAALLDASADARDRLVLVDIPATNVAASSAVGWIDALRSPHDPTRRRSAAVYHPALVVLDPLGGAANPVRKVPASGHLAGVISRLDRERGAYYSPANAPIYEAVDVAGLFAEPEQAALNDAGINVLRCSDGGGLEVWGARTLDLDPYGRFVAHRRLVHRLVRAIRRVAEPLVFEANGPELRLTLARSVTSVLLEAFNAGALLGANPADGFRVQCDEANNPPEEQDLGRVVCDIELAPAAPMEHIHLRLSLGPAGLLEVVET